MAPINATDATPLEQVKNFFNIQDGLKFKHSLSEALNLTAFILGYLTSAAVTVTVLAAVYLAYRFMRIKFGARVQPKGDKAVIITGATSGIGLAVTKQMYKHGFTVFACYFNDKEPGYAELEELSKAEHPFVGKSKRQTKVLGKEASLFLVHMDVRSQESIVKASEEIESKLNKHELSLHCLLNNAGIGCGGSFEWLDHQTINITLETNLRGVLLVTRQFARRIILDKGRILNVSSGLSNMPRKFTGLYGLTKSAVDYFSESLDDELRRYGAMCLCLRPGDLMSTSNIMCARYKTPEQMTENLSATEKDLYKESLEEYQFFINKIIEVKLENSNDEAQRLSAIHGTSIPDLETLRSLNAKQGKKISFFARLISLWLEFIASADASKKLEDTGILTAFKYAICAEKPLGTLFPGTSIYCHISGPLTNLLPPPLACKMSRTLLRKHGV